VNDISPAPELPLPGKTEVPPSSLCPESNPENQPELHPELVLVLRESEWSAASANRPQHDTSPELLAQARDAGNGVAWRRLIQVYTPFLYGWLRREQISHQDADDLVQEVLATVARELPTFRHSGNIGAFRRWLKTILKNRLRTFRRSQKTRYAVFTNSALLDTLAGQLEDPESSLSEDLDREHDHHLAQQLLAMEREFSPTMWTSFKRTVVDGEKDAAVAEALGITVETVYCYKSCVKSRMRKWLQQLTEFIQFCS
jgi:RNA polymerase sigma factor (sigma-70 family)